MTPRTGRVALAATLATVLLTPFFAERGAAATPLRDQVAARRAERASGPALRVDVGTGRHRISPDIYGVNFADSGFATATSTCRSTAGAATPPRPTTGRSAAATTARTGTSPTSPTAGADAFDYCQRGQDYSAADAQVQQDRHDRHRDAADPAAAGLGRQRGVATPATTRAAIPPPLQPAGRPRPLPLGLRQRAAQRASGCTADPTAGRRAVGAGVLGASGSPP